MYSRTASWLWNSKMSKPLSRQVTFAHLSYRLSGEEPAKKKAAGPTTFGKPKILDEGGHVKASMLPVELQRILTPKTSMAPCAALRKSSVFVKRPALSSTPSPSSDPGKKSPLLISAHGQGTAHAPRKPHWGRQIRHNGGWFGSFSARRSFVCYGWLPFHSAHLCSLGFGMTPASTQRRVICVHPGSFMSASLLVDAGCGIRIDQQCVVRAVAACLAVTC